MSVGNKRVLVVSDAPSVNKNIEASLESSGYDTVQVSTEAACLEEMARGEPALVFIALFSEGVDTSRLLDRILEFERGIPVVLIADDTTAGRVVDLLQRGANDYLLYPVAHPSLVRHAVARNIEQRTETRKRERGERDLKRRNAALGKSLKVLEQDQQAAMRVQQGMLPQTPFNFGALQLRHLIVPSLILSGDFIDYFELPDGRLLFYIADVSGHGTSGAIVTALLKSLSTRLYNEFEELALGDAGEILGWINRELAACGLPQHVTMFLGVMDRAGRELQYANAAHFPGAILSAGKSTRYLEVGGLPLGIYETAKYQARRLALPETFEMVMFSDGVFEILPEASLKEKEQRLLSLVECGQGDIGVLADQLGLGEVKEVPDDIAVFMVAKAG